MHHLYNKKKSVLEVLNAGKLQVKKYVSSLSAENANIPHHAFVVVQVGYPLIVKKA